MYVITRPGESKIIASVSIGRGKYYGKCSIENTRQFMDISREETAKYLKEWRNAGLSIKKLK